MKFGTWLRVLVAVYAIAQIGSASYASAAGSTLSTTSTPLGKIIVNGQGMTAYFYDLDKAHSGVSACTGACSANWPAITSKSAKPTLSGIKGKVSVLSHTKQIAINGRPIYTFVGDYTKGDTNGQGLGGVWYVVSPNGAELKIAKLFTPMTPSNSPSPSPTPTSTPDSAGTPATSPSPTAIPAPSVSATAGTDPNSNY